MRNLANELERKIKNREAEIGVIGLGYVGLPLAVEFAEVGFRVTGVDLDPAKISGIRAGRSHVEDVPSDTVARLVRKKMLRARSSYKGCGKFDAIFILSLIHI